MEEIILSSAAIFYYTAVICAELSTKYGHYYFERTNSRKVLAFAKALSFACVAFLIYYSYTTHWWSFIPLMAMNVLIYVFLNNLFKWSYRFYLKTRNGIVATKNGMAVSSPYQQATEKAF